MEGQLGSWSPAADGQVRQDKFPESLGAQFGRNLVPALTFRHFRPQENETVERLTWREPKPAFSRSCGRIRLAGKPATSRVPFLLCPFMLQKSTVRSLGPIS